MITTRLVVSPSRLRPILSNSSLHHYALYDIIFFPLAIRVAWYDHRFGQLRKDNLDC